MRTVWVLIAAGDDGMHPIIGTVVSAGKGRARWEIHAPETNGEVTVRHCLHQGRFDLCCLVLNNIIFTDREPLAARLNASLRLVRDLALRESMPVVALYCWPDDQDYHDQLAEAGATAVFPLPFNPEHLREVISNLTGPNNVKPG